MIHKSVYNDTYPKNQIEIIQVRTGSTTEGEVLLDVDRLEDVLSLVGTIYLCTAPTCLTEKWTRTGSDLATSDILNLSSIKLSDGKNKIKWRFDPSGVGSIADGQFYSISISVNAGQVSTTSQAQIEMIIKIINSVIEGS